MDHRSFFGNAEWIGTGNDLDMPLIRQSFTAKEGEKATVTALGFGVFIIYINGIRVHKEEYLPLNTDFEDRHFPATEKLRHRAYPESFDVSPYLVDGENVISVLLGNGWYNRPVFEEKHCYGRKKVCYRIALSESGDVLSDHNKAVWVKGPVIDNHFHRGETHDMRISYQEAMLPGYEGESFPLVAERPVDTEYYTTKCPRDVAKEEIIPELLREENGERLYDFGVNTVGYPTLVVKAKEGEEILVEFSEALTKDGATIDCEHVHRQHLRVIGCGEEIRMRPLFGWLAARYAKVTGDAEIEHFTVVRADVDSTTTFDSDRPVLNYLHKTYVNTQLCNIHGGTPSDCPQIERRGYTGDGQLCAHAGMLMFSSKEMYRKWLYDIADCQDSISGHVQYTAPYTYCGGGPGGWGSAIAIVPYNYYLHYGDIGPAKEMFDGMLRYLDYLDAHSENMLVTSDQPGLWCLGDWCTPDPVALPAPFVNNYFYVKTCTIILELLPILGKEELADGIKKRIEERRSATRAAYFNTWDGNFIGGIQGANAFALDMGIGDERTKSNLINYYERIGYYDTGIFGTEIVTRLLFEYGRGDIALRLMQADEPHGFGRFMKIGATTLWEYWGDVARSHSHPMFGAVTAFLFDYLLGIKQREGTVGYTDLVISPLVDLTERAGGSLQLPMGRIYVSFVNADGTTTVKVTLPAGIKAVLAINGKTVPLTEGENSIAFPATK